MENESSLERYIKVFPNPEAKCLKGVFEEEPFQMKTENADWKEESFGLTKGVPTMVAHTTLGPIKETVPLGYVF